MAIYTVHAPPEADSPADAADRLQFIPEGFSIGALILPLPWLLWNRLWLMALAYGAALVGAEFAGRQFGELPVSVVAALLSLWLAIEARELKRWTLTRRGWRMIGVVEGGDLDIAEHRFLSALSDKLREEPAGPGPGTVAGMASGPVSRPRPRASVPVIGLFPEAGRSGR